MTQSDSAATDEKVRFTEGCFYRLGKSVVRKIVSVVPVSWRARQSCALQFFSFPFPLLNVLFYC